MLVRGWVGLRMSRLCNLIGEERVDSEMETVLASSQAFCFAVLIKTEGW